jgi:serine/threonine protein kinase
VSPQETVGHYRIAGRLGAGGMGIVYKAEDLKLGRIVALKFLPAELSKTGVARDRFLQEAKAASALDHPNIGIIHGIEETPDGQLFIVMAYYDGETLADRIRRGPLLRRDALAVAFQMGEALAEAHSIGILRPTWVRRRTTEVGVGRWWWNSFRQWQGSGNDLGPVVHAPFMSSTHCRPLSSTPLSSTPLSSTPLSSTPLR